MKEIEKNLEKIPEADRIAWKSFVRYRRMATGLLMLMGIFTLL